VVLWAPGVPPFGECGVTQLQEFLTVYARADDIELAVWVEEVRELREAQAMAAKIEACPGREPKRGDDRPACFLRRETHTHRANGDIKPKKEREAVQGA
jgi:hypothetical protein